MKIAGRAIEPAGRVPRKARRALELVGKALEPAVRAVGPAERALEPAGRPRASWEGRLRGPGRGQRKRKLFLVCGGTIGHHPLWGYCPISERVSRGPKYN